MRGPDFRFGAHETRAEQPPDDHPCPREIECSWGFARGFRAAPCRDVPAETERRRTWGSNGCGHLSWDLIGSMSSPHSRELIEPIGSHERGRQPIDPKRAILPRWRHWSAIVEAGELRSREKAQPNVTVTSTCFNQNKKVSPWDVVCTQRLRPNLASAVGTTCLWPHSPATFRPSPRVPVPAAPVTRGANCPLVFCTPAPGTRTLPAPSAKKYPQFTRTLRFCTRNLPAPYLACTRFSLRFPQGQVVPRLSAGGVRHNSPEKRTCVMFVVMLLSCCLSVKLFSLRLRMQRQRMHRPLFVSSVFEAEGSMRSSERW